MHLQNIANICKTTQKLVKHSGGGSVGTGGGSLRGTGGGELGIEVLGGAREVLGGARKEGGARRLLREAQEVLRIILLKQLAYLKSILRGFGFLWFLCPYSNVIFATQ